MLITNKNKQTVRCESKAETARFLRRTANIPVEELQVVRYRSKPGDTGDPRTRTGICPVCLAKLVKSGRGTRYPRGCKNCGACLAPELLCAHCMTKRVWRGKSGSYCKGCGCPCIRISASKIKHA